MEKKKKWKIGEKMGGKSVWIRGEGGEKSGRAQLFSFWVHHNSISPKWRENVREKEEECVAQNFPSPSNSQLFVFFYFCLSLFFFGLDKISSGLHSTFTLFFFFLDKILHSRLWFFLFVFICFFYFFIFFLFLYPFSICLFYK